MTTPPVSAMEAVKTIPLALQNLHIPEPLQRYVHNYMVNLLITVLSDDAFRERVNTELPKVLEDLVKA